MLTIEYSHETVKSNIILGRVALPNDSDHHVDEISKLAYFAA